MEMYAYISYIIYELNWIDLWIYRLTSVQKTLKIYTFCCAPTPKRRNISESGTHGYESKLWCPSKTLKTETVNLCKCALQSSNYGNRRIWHIHKKIIEGILATQLLSLPPQPQPQWDCRQQSPPGKWVWWWLPVPRHLIWIAAWSKRHK